MLSFLGPIMALSFMGVITMQQALLPIVIMIAIVLVVVLAISMIYGQMARVSCAAWRSHVDACGR